VRGSLPPNRSGLGTHTLAAGGDAGVQLTWREGSRAALASHFPTLQVRPAGRDPTARLADNGSLPAARCPAVGRMAARGARADRLLALRPRLRHRVLKHSHTCEGQVVRWRTMRIGELAERTGVSRRLLRYYEEQRLITPSRAPNGYREYKESHLDVVLQIKGLLDAGLPTRIIQQLLPCLNKSQTIYVPDVTSEMVAILQREQARLSERIDCLTRNRDAIVDYLEEVLSVKSANDEMGLLHA
jgi:DNA-binding transcriptional MerR regulator